MKKLSITVFLEALADLNTKEFTLQDVNLCHRAHVDFLIAELHHAYLAGCMDTKESIINDNNGPDFEKYFQKTYL